MRSWTMTFSQISGESDDVVGIQLVEREVTVFSFSL